MSACYSGRLEADCEAQCGGTIEITAAVHVILAPATEIVHCWLRKLTQERDYNVGEETGALMEQSMC